MMGMWHQDRLLGYMNCKYQYYDLRVEKWIRREDK
jgi:hypothetical protein